MNAYVNGIKLVSDIKIASRFFEKLRGIFFIDKPVLLTNTNAIHTFFLNKNISAIFIDKNGKILKFCENIKPNRIVFPVKNACKVLEFNASFIKSAKISVGDIIEFSE
ncbi:MAG: DUF192 domain-containing protein [bacterium]|nr:DUF192 domain-containing protein [bacterium]